MANEIAVDQPSLTGATLYAHLARTGQKWNGTAFENVAAANWGNYDVALTESGAGSGYWVGSIPVAINTAGLLDVTVFRQSGGSPATTDPLVAGGALDWSGSAVATVASRSTYAGADTAGTTTLLTRVPGTIQPQTGDAFARLGAGGAGLTALGDPRIVNLDIQVSSRLATAGYTAPPTANQARDAVFQYVVDGATTFAEAVRGQNSALMGKASGLATATAAYRDLADSKPRLTATVDADGNRTAVIRDLT